MKKYIQAAYENCIYIYNNGSEYEFYKRFGRRPTKIILALGDVRYTEDAIQHNKKYMDKNDFDELWQLIDRDKKPWGFAEFPSKQEQEKITNNFKKEVGLMKKVEYKVEYWADVFTSYACANSGLIEEHLAWLGQQLTASGMEGWELQNVDFDVDGVDGYWIFKRSIEDKQ
jgi:hypothetical protein